MNENTTGIACAIYSKLPINKPDTVPPLHPGGGAFIVPNLGRKRRELNFAPDHRVTAPGHVGTHPPPYHQESKGEQLV